MMSFQELMGKALQGRRTGGPGRSQAKRRSARPSLEAFEERLLLSGVDLDPLRPAAELESPAAGQAHLSGVWGTIVGHKANLSAKLTAGDGSPIAGQTINFRIGMKFVGSAQTDADGVATLKGVKLGNLKIRNYIARTIAVLPASSGFPRTVSRGPLALPRTTPTLTPTTMDSVLAAGTYGGNAFYSATLTSNNTPVPGKAISFLVGNQVIGTATTDASGVAIFRGTSPSGLNAGTYTLSAKFAGDSGASASNGAGTLNVAKATASITVNGPTTTYNGQQVTASAVTLPASLPVVYAYADAGGHSVSNPTDAGVYQVTATINDPNYIGSAMGSMTIARATVGISGLTVSDKVYDGTTTATINTAGATLSGVVPGDTLTIDTTAATAAFASKNVGANQLATITGLALSGSDAVNYKLASSSVATTASIMPKAISATGFTAADKVYDGNTSVWLNFGGVGLSGVVPGDAVGINAADAFGAFLTKSAGQNKAVGIGNLALTGADAGNYTLLPAATTANITPKAVTVSGVIALDKVYDGTTVASLDTSVASIQGMISGDAVSLDTAASVGTFSDKNAGPDKVVTINGLVLSGADAGNYLPIGTATTWANITPAPLTIGGITADKVYDGTDTATLDTALAAITGLASGDDVTLDASAVVASFADKNAGEGKAVSYTGLSLVGADLGNYSITLPAITANISPKSLNLVTPVLAFNKVYDGSTAANVNVMPPIVTGQVGGDSVWVDFISAITATGTFADKDAGTGKTVTIHGLTLLGVDAANYALAPVTTTADITPKSAVVLGVTAQDKVYDGTTDATIDTSGAVLTAIVPGDDVTMSTAGAIGNFEAKNAQSYSLYVWVTGVTLGGADAGNYHLLPVESFGYISKKALGVSGIAASNKVYDGTTAAPIDATDASLAGVVAGDDATLDASLASGSFADRNVGVGKAVTIAGLALNGIDAGNYTLTDPGLTADITPKTVTINTPVFFPSFKQYDGTTTAPSPMMPTPGGVIIGDIAAFDFSGVTDFTLASKNVGVQVATANGLALSGSDAGNYMLDPTYHVTVTPRLISVSGITASGKTYDGTTVAAINLGDASFAGVLPGDDVTIDDSAATGRFDDKNAGTGKTVFIDGIVKSGADAGNYDFHYFTGITADVTPLAISLVGSVVANKTYDGQLSATVMGNSPTLVGGLGGDDVSFYANTILGTFADKNAGTGKTVTITGYALSGTDAGNYSLAPVTATASITRASLTVSGITANKVYDGTTNATLDATAATLSGAVAGDNVSVDLGAATANFADKNVGTGKAVTVTGLALAGTDAGNYDVTFAPITGDITARVLHIDGFTATNRTYDGTTGVNVGSAGISFGAGDVVGGDDVSFDFASLASAAGTMADKNAGNGKAVTVSGLAITGADAANYTIVATTTVDIAKATLSVTGIPSLTKNYDGNQYFVSIDTASASLIGIIGVDTVLLNTAGVFGVSTSANVGTWNVFINGLALGGTDAGNYNLGAVIVSGTIQGT